MKQLQVGLCLAMAIIVSALATNPVQVSVYYESLCPDSKDFIANQLWPAYQTVSPIFNTTFVPFGNANFTKVGSTWQFHCQHGPRECLGNKIHGCALKYYAPNETTPFISCSMAAEDPVNQSEQCALDNHLNWDTINTCANSEEGDDILHSNGVLTLDLSPRVTWVPWIIINDVYSQSNEDLAQSNFLKLVCDNYTGTKPTGCNNPQ